MPARSSGRSWADIEVFVPKILPSLGAYDFGQCAIEPSERRDVLHNRIEIRGVKPGDLTERL